MKTIIAGSRNFNNYKFLCNALKVFGEKITTVVSGGARGVDALGERWATENNIPIERYPANWFAHGKVAEPIRNAQMADNADSLIAFWDGKSKGTKNMLDLARKQKLSITVIKISEDNI